MFIYAIKNSVPIVYSEADTDTLMYVDTILRIISPSLDPFFHLSTPDFLSVAQRHFTRITSIPNIHRSIVPASRNRKVHGREAHPCSPSNIDLIMTSFTLAQKSGLYFLLPMMPDKQHGRKHKRCHLQKEFKKTRRGSASSHPSHPSTLEFSILLPIVDTIV